MSHAPLVVIVFPTERAPTSTRYGGFARRLQKAGGLKGCDVLTVALENLAFIVDESGGAQVLDTVSGQDIGRADYVYLKSWEAMPEEASALAVYLQGKGIPFMDSAATGVGVSKLASTMRFWAQGISVPLTVYVRRADRLVELLSSGWAEKLGDRFIVKDIQGAKGKLNFLLPLSDVAATVQQHSDAQFICQRFIPNDGDYRIGVYAGIARFVISRVGNGDSHLNNTSAGGSAAHIPVADMSQELLKLAERTADAVGLQVAGVDIIIDKHTKTPYILEANQGSQIVTGAFVDENIRAFNEGLDDAIRLRRAHAFKAPMRILGRRSTIAFPDLGVTCAVAKVDTGAYSSTLHAENIHIETTPSGGTELVFTIVPADKLVCETSEPTEIRITDYYARHVRSSNGQSERRYSFKTKFVIDGKEFIAALTLSNRSEMAYPALIGRRAVRSRFMVNVELDEPGNPLWKY